MVILKELFTEFIFSFTGYPRVLETLSKLLDVKDAGPLKPFIVLRLCLWKRKNLIRHYIISACRIKINICQAPNTISSSWYYFQYAVPTSENDIF